MKPIVNPIFVAPEVAEAIHARRGVVALESTLISHGLPWPENLVTALASESAVRKAGAVPATIAVIGGKIRVGLTREILEGLARGTTPVLKAGRRDLAHAVARGLEAATTVAATLWVAQKAGIGVMATGGLGGVHRQWPESLDISNDLEELSRADGCVVVCSGAKSILDIPATLEYLETRGVAVIGYRTGEFPAFLTRTSRLPLEIRVETAKEFAEIVAVHRTLGLPGALILAQAVPEFVGLDRGLFESVLADALAEARAQGISGKAVTPFLLGKIRDATAGRSLAANVALIVSNAGLAGEVAAELEVGSPQGER